MTHFFGVVFMICAGWQVAADRGVPAQSPPVSRVVTVGKIPTTTVNRGDSVTVIIPIVIAEGYHVQANPASDEFLIPLELELQPEKPESLLSWRSVYPKPGTFRLEGTTEDLLTYHGSIAVEVLIYASPEARGGKRLFTGILSYQACDRKRCLFPTSVPVKFKMVVTEDNNDN